jgi:hypothetical protein
MRSEFLLVAHPVGDERSIKPGKFHMADWEATKEAYQRPLSLMMRRWVG